MTEDNVNIIDNESVKAGTPTAVTVPTAVTTSEVTTPAPTANDDGARRSAQTPYKNHIKAKKDEMRTEYRARRQAMSAEEKSARDGRICDTALSLVSFRYADIVLMYAPTGEEIDIMPIAAAALERGKRVVFPRCDTEARTMTYRFVDDLAMLAPDAYGIREPSADTEIYDPATDNSPAVCFVPGLVYDKRGYRLGYGKGFYDRYLIGFRGGTIGVIYSDFIVKDVPKGRFDMSVDILLTEKGVRVVDK